MDAPVEGVVFDLDGTLCEYRRPGQEVLDSAFEAVGVEALFTVTDYYTRFDDYVVGSDDIREIRTRCFADLADEAGRDPSVGEAVADAYAAERDHSDVRWVPGAEAALDALGEQYPLVLVTNGDPWMQGQKLAALEIETRFETVVHAGFDAPSKPAPEPFYRALDAAAVDPTRAVHVGDSPGHDVAGAHNAGLRSVWLDRSGRAPPDPSPHHQIESMHELLDEPWR